MPQIIHSEKIPIRLWLDKVDAETLRQAKNLANLPFAFHHIALMPDAHLGYGMPIGGVLAAADHIVPNAVGVDIGCGMRVVRSNLAQVDPERLRQVLVAVRKAVPLGFAHHKKNQDPALMPAAAGLPPVVAQEFDRALKQIGTLGGGNHFIEFQRADDGRVWIMVHSGSRNLGFRVAGHYNRLAMEENRRLARPLPDSWQLAALPLAGRCGQEYLQEMKYCVAFALANRRLMLERITALVGDFFPGAVFEPPVDIAHNYAAVEEHFGRQVVLHRKGATSARAGETGIVPGSQGSESFIVRGLGNPESFHSAAHGAGRRMGRKEAERLLNLEEEKRRLDDKGILHGIRGKHDLDEAPGAYKDIGQVMARQADLVEIVNSLSPFAVIKG